ncbi:hypothetical protein VZT92_025161 [Zoarces viviparus]|uniref:Uncharacterized protein n=1 Tax=Zoarces viviparus TaxID=48416 RepID=A0AAW1E565_ZOAVI
MSCGMTAAQKPREPKNKAGSPAASASSLITFRLHQHRFTHANRDFNSLLKIHRCDRERSMCPRTGSSFRFTGGTWDCEWPRAPLNHSDAAFTCSL